MIPINFFFVAARHGDQWLIEDGRAHFAPAPPNGMTAHQVAWRMLVPHSTQPCKERIATSAPERHAGVLVVRRPGEHRAFTANCSSWVSSSRKGVSRDGIRRAPRDPDSVKRWLTFLRNHREAIAAMDFFTVPTLTFGVLYCFFVIGHHRRKILHCNVTRNPSALWVVQQLREAWAYKQPHRFLLFDRDAKFGAEVVSAVRDMGSEPTRTAFRSPWQNGVAERWVGSCRRDLLDHVIILNERHLKRLMSSYLLYYHEDRTHLGLAKDTPASRPTEIRSARETKIQSFPRLGGLHHRYAVAA